MKKVFLILVGVLMAVLFTGCFESTTTEKKVAKLDISANPILTGVNQVVTLTALPKDADGKEVAGVAVEYFYSVNNKAESKVAANSNTFRTTEVGTVKVYGKAGDIKSNTVTITVQAGTLPVYTVTLTGPSTAKVGESVTFNSTVKIDGEVQANAPVTYMLQDSNKAINNPHTFTTEGTYVVYAEIAGVKSNSITIAVTKTVVEPTNTQVRLTNPDFKGQDGKTYVTRPHVKLYFYPVGSSTPSGTVSYEEDLSKATKQVWTSYKSIPAGSYQITYESINSVGVSSGERIALNTNKSDVFTFTAGKNYTLSYYTEGDITSANIIQSLDN